MSSSSEDNGKAAKLSEGRLSAINPSHCGRHCLQGRNLTKEDWMSYAGGDYRYNSVAQHLHNMHRALSSIPITEKRKGTGLGT